MWIVAAASLVGTVANVYQRRWCFLVWIATNGCWIAYDVYKTAYPQAALMSTYLALSVLGWFKWAPAPLDGDQTTMEDTE